MFQYMQPEELKDIIETRNEDKIESFINILKKERDKSLGINYPKFTAAITVLEGCLEQSRRENALHRMIEANRIYGSSYNEFDDDCQEFNVPNM